MYALIGWEVSMMEILLRNLSAIGLTALLLIIIFQLMWPLISIEPILILLVPSELVTKQMFASKLEENALQTPFSSKTLM